MKRKINGSSILTYQNRRYLFENILCNNSKINHSQITLKAFHCFVYLFLSINLEEGMLTYDKDSIMKLFWFDDADKSEAENIRTVKKGIGNLVTEVHSFAILGFETLWRVICSSQYEDVLYQGELFLTSIYLKLNVAHFNDQLIYETFFEKVFLMMSLENHNNYN